MSGLSKSVGTQMSEQAVVRNLLSLPRSEAHDPYVKGKGKHAAAYCYQCGAHNPGAISIAVLVAQGSRQHVNRMVRRHRQYVGSNCG